MDSQSQRKASPSGHESHVVHPCHRCGWPFPNPHPSAKHRRAHKKICGTVEGYKLIDSEEHKHLAGSDDEQLSDDDRRTPSPKIEKRSIDQFTSGGVLEISNKLEDEVFSDAVTEFSDTGFGTAIEERLESARESVKNVEKFEEDDLRSVQSLEVDANAVAGQMHSPEVHERAVNQLGSTAQSKQSSSSCIIDSEVSSVSDTGREELVVGLSSTSDSACELSSIKSEKLMDVPEEYTHSNTNKDSKTGLGQKDDVNGNEDSNVDKIFSNIVPCSDGETVSEAFEADSKLAVKDEKTPDLVTTDKMVELKKEKNDGLVSMTSKRDLYNEVEFVEHMEAIVNIVRVESDPTQNVDVGSDGVMVEVCDTKEEGNEDVHVISVATDVYLVDHPEAMIEDFKDYKTVRSNIPLYLGSDDAIDSKEDGAINTVYEESLSSFQACNLGKRINTTSADTNALEDNLKHEGGGKNCIVEEVPAEEEGHTLEVKAMSDGNLESSDLEASQTTIKTDEEKIQTDHSLERLEPCDFDNHTTNVSGVDNADDIENRTEDHDTHRNDNKKGDTEEQLAVENTLESKLDQISNLPGPDDTGNHEMTGNEFFDMAGSGSTREAAELKYAVNTKTLESTCHFSAPQVVMDGVDDSLNNSQKTSKVDNPMNGFGSMTGTDSESGNGQDEDYKEAVEELELSNDDEVPATCAVVVCSATNSICAGDVTVLRNSSENINLAEPEPLDVDSEFSTKNSDIVEGKHRRNVNQSVSGASSNPLKGEGEYNFTKEHVGVSTVDMSIDSSSQTDSLEANWGSVSVLSIQSDAAAAVEAEALPTTDSQPAGQSQQINLQKPKAAFDEQFSEKSDASEPEPPSFATLVESREEVDPEVSSSEIQIQHSRQPKPEALQAGWFPSLTNVVNESHGRKKNEEIIAKVTNWSTGKQHTPLKNLLGEADLENKPKSPNPKQSPTLTQKDDIAAKNNGASVTTVSSILGPEAPTEQLARKDAAKEWNSPARYPTDDKKEKRKVKGRPYWVPFVCCSSVN